MNRLSAKKKRTTKLFELEFLKEEKQHLTQENESIKWMNDHLKERIALVKSFLPFPAPQVAAGVSVAAPVAAAPAQASATLAPAPIKRKDPPQAPEQLLLQKVIDTPGPSANATGTSSSPSLDSGTANALQQLLSSQVSRQYSIFVAFFLCFFCFR